MNEAKWWSLIKLLDGTKMISPGSLMGEFQQMPEVSGLRLFQESMEIVIGLMGKTFLHGWLITLSFLLEVKIRV